MRLLDDDTVLAGRSFAFGVFQLVSLWFVAAVVITLVINSFRATDDCDNGRDRCGMSVLTDAKTGVEYLSDGKGGLVVRVQK